MRADTWQTPLRGRLLMLPALALLVSGCGIISFGTGGEQPPIPEGPVDPIGSRPTGPVTVVGQGISGNVGWRYAVYPSEDGHCFQLDMSGSSSSCGPVPDLARDEILLMGAGTSTGHPSHIEVLAGQAVVDVVLHTRDDRPLRAEPLDLSRTGLDVHLFLVLLERGAEPSFLVGFDVDGNEVATVDATDAFG